MTGYWYQQVANDRPPSADSRFGGFRSSGVGIGPTVLGTVRIGQRDINVIGKWLHDLDTHNRLSGNLAMLSVALKL